MIRSRFVRSFVVALTAFAAFSCSDTSPTAPAVVLPNAEQEALLSGLLGGILQPVTSIVGFVADATGLTVRPVTWNSSYQRVSHSVSGYISPWGGTLTIPESDFSIYFPAGAVSTTTLITITSDPNYVAYKMAPQGTKFLRPVLVTQKLGKTAVGGQPLNSRLFGAYVADDLLDLGSILNALEIELSATIFAPGSTLPDSQIWAINHFSRYMLSSG
jgi:hypothetical protein